MKIAITGAGVIGGILGACLLDKGEDVLIVEVSEKRAADLKSRGIRVQDPKNCIKGDFAVKAPKIATSLDALEGFSPDVVFVCVKTSAIEAVMPAIERVYRKGAAVVSFQNGLDTEEVMAELLGDRTRVMRVVVNFAGKLTEDGASAVGFFTKPNYIGILDANAQGRAQEIAALLTSCGLDTKFTDKLDRQVWEKVILNSSLSPVCALTGLTMKDALDHKHLNGVIAGVIREGISVGTACGVAFEDGFFEHCMGYLEKGGRHKPSMLVDVEAGRKTEIDFLNGMIAKRGSQKSIPTPHNQTITALIKGVEQNLQEGRKQ